MFSYSLAVKNSWDRLDDLAMIIDFGLTLAGAQKTTLRQFLMDFKTNATKYAIPAAMNG